MFHHIHVQNCVKRFLGAQRIECSDTKFAIHRRTAQQTSRASRQIWIGLQASPPPSASAEHRGHRSDPGADFKHVPSNESPKMSCDIGLPVSCIGEDV